MVGERSVLMRKMIKCKLWGFSEINLSGDARENPSQKCPVEVIEGWFPHINV